MAPALSSGPQSRNRNLTNSPHGHWTFIGGGVTTKLPLRLPIRWPVSCGLSGSMGSLMEFDPSPDSGSTSFRDLHRLRFELMMNRSDRRGGKPRTSLTITGRATDWLPARGFHHGPKPTRFTEEAGDTTAV